MSEKEDRPFRVTWRSLAGTTGAAGEILNERKFTAAYFQRDGDLLVFKRTDGAQVFTVAEEFVETIDALGDAVAVSA